MPEAILEKTQSTPSKPSDNKLITNLRSDHRNKLVIDSITPVKFCDFSKSSTRCNSINDDDKDPLIQSLNKMEIDNWSKYDCDNGSGFTQKTFQQNHKYKTEICKNYQLYGYCKWGDNCCFAHGKDELRLKTLFNYFYKTKICKHFHRDGFCPYASRCQYFHFKSYEVYKELLDSLEKKLITRINDEKNVYLESILGSSERNQGR